MNEDAKLEAMIDLWDRGEATAEEVRAACLGHPKDVRDAVEALLDEEVTRLLECGLAASLYDPTVRAVCADVAKRLERAGMQSVLADVMRPDGKAFPEPVPPHRDSVRCSFRLAACGGGAAAGRGPGLEVKLFPHSRPDWTTVLLVAERSVSAVKLFVGATRVEFVKPLDRYGYAAVRKSDVAAVVDGAAELRVQADLT